MAERERDNELWQVSLILMEIFHQLGVNQNILCIRQKNWKQFEQLESFMDRNERGSNVSSTCYKVFGSQIEGSTTPGLQSDLDVVYFDTSFLAIKNIQDFVPGIENLLMVHDEHTFPAYCKLQMLRSTQYGVIPLYTGDMDVDSVLDVDHQGRIVFKHSNIFTSNERHGPAAVLTDGPRKVDIILSIRVNSWVQEAIPWLTRHRQCSWITPDDLENFLKKKAFLVPVGHSLSHEKEVKWRISFTSIERKLMWKLNNTQMACYVLMKIIIKSFITPTIGECLSSYHCKTALFFLLDTTEKNFWKPNNLLPCLRLLLKTISLMAFEGCCPNYFISQENMFYGKITGPVRWQLCKILDSLIDMEFKYLVQIECDQVGKVLSNACSRLCNLQEIPSNIGHLVTMTQDTTSVFSIKSIFEGTIINVLRGYNKLLKQSGHTVSQVLLFTLIHGFQTGSRLLKDILFVLMSFLSSHIGCQMASSCFVSQNFHPQDIGKVYKFLLLGTGSDVTSGKLKLAGFYLKMGYPAQAEAVLSAVENELILNVYQVSSQDLYEGYIGKTTMEKILSENLTTSQIFQTCIAASVTYLPSEIHITLPPLCYEMFRSAYADPALRDPDEHYWYDWAVVDARPYLYFLQYQTYSALGMDRHKTSGFKEPCMVTNSQENNIS